MSDMEWMSDLKASDLWNALVTIPAILAWLGFGLALLLGPHFVEQPDPLLWALYGAGGWFALLFVICGGWFALFVLSVGV